MSADSHLNVTVKINKDSKIYAFADAVLGAERMSVKRVKKELGIIMRKNKIVIILTHGRPAQLIVPKTMLVELLKSYSALIS